MKTILVISKGYLEAIYKESKKYRTNIVGCGNFKVAEKLLNTIDFNSLIGVVVLDKTLPASNTKDFQYFKKFFQTLGELQMPLKVKLITYDASPANYKSLLKTSKLLNVVVQTNIEAVTSSLIDREVFGSILFDTFKPYKLSEDVATESKGSKDFQLVKIMNLMSSYVLSVVSDILQYSDVEETIRNDTVLKSFVENQDTFLQRLRKCVIYLEAGVDQRVELTDLENSLQEEMSKDSFCERMAIFHYVVEKYANKRFVE